MLMFGTDDTIEINVFLSSVNRVFPKLTTLTLMTILASEVLLALLREKNPVTKCYPSEY